MNELPKLTIEPNEVVNFLKRKAKYKEVWQQILCQRLIYQTAQERGIIVTPEEVQAEADRQRRAMRLEKAADTVGWLAEQMICLEDWEAGIRDRLLTQKLAEALFEKEVEKFFAQNRLDFEQILLYQIIVQYEKLAQELYYQIAENEISFYEAAHLYDVDERRRQQCGYEGKVYRWDLKPDVAAVIFSAQPKEAIGPVKSEEGYHLFIVEEFIPAKLTPERYQEILNQMFQQWLMDELNHTLNS